MAKIEFNNVSKLYDKSIAVDSINFNVNEKEFVVLVGPSGSGKSTTLRMLAGLESISDGEIKIKNKVINELEPSKRGLSMVFQSYALYPHMTIFNNLAFALQNKKLDKVLIKEKVHNIAELLDLTKYLDSLPSALSGGQKQRVALGSALIHDTDIVLMDEPLSNLDARLRGQIRKLLINIHRKLNKTILYVTHDQTEAMTMATRIVIFNEGKIQQIDTPTNVYQKPANLFVAEFIGVPQMNLFYQLISSFPENELVRLIEDIVSQQSINSIDIVLGIRPEDIRIAKNDDSYLPATVTIIESLGNEYLVHALIGKETVIFKLKNKDKIKVGDSVPLTLDISKLHLFNRESGERVHKFLEENHIEGNRIK